MQEQIARLQNAGANNAGHGKRGNDYELKIWSTIRKRKSIAPAERIAYRKHFGNNALYKNHRQATLGQKSCHLGLPAVRERKQRDDRDVTAGAYCQQGLSYRIANRSRASCAHNTLRASIGLNITP